MPAPRKKMAVTRPLPQALDVGDTIALAITLSENYQTVRAEASTTIRQGESVLQAQDRLEKIVFAQAERLIEGLN